jgi:dehydrogenase/reductase SDR family protein 13
MLHAAELSRRLEGTGVTAYSLHPGVVATELGREWSTLFKLFLTPISWIFFKTPCEGAQTTIYLATEKGIEEHSGKYFSDCHTFKPRTSVLNDPADATKLWEVSKELLELE